MDLCFAVFELSLAYVFFQRAIFHVRLMKWFISVRCYVSEFESIVRKAFANNVGSDFSLEGPICIILEL